MFRVIFTYDEASQKWEATVEGATSNVEARQGFSAVVLTCQELHPDLLNHTIVTPSANGFVITPAV